MTDDADRAAGRAAAPGRGGLRRPGRRCAAATPTGSSSGSRCAPPGAPDPVQSRDAFAVRCGARQRERQLGTGYGYGIFIDGHFAGEINLSIVQRGPFQSSYVGYWIDEKQAGQGYMPEALVLLCRTAFEDLHLHRVQISIIPRNTASRRVVEKLGDPRRGRRPALPRDQRRVGGPHPLRHHRRGVGRAPRRADGRLDRLSRLLLGDLGLEGGDALLEGGLLERPHLRLELAVDRGGVVVDRRPRRRWWP